MQANRKEEQNEYKHGAPDMLNGPLWNKLLLFAAPVAATAILEQLFNASDKTVAVAAVSANSAVIALLCCRPAKKAEKIKCTT